MVLLKIAQNVQIGYFAQNQASLLDGELTVFDTIDRAAVGEIRTKIRDILGAFMFGGEASDKQVNLRPTVYFFEGLRKWLMLMPINRAITDAPM